MPQSTSKYGKVQVFIVKLLVKDAKVLGPEILSSVKVFSGRFPVQN